MKTAVMIPEFDENGNLPPGVHFCTWEEFVERFGTTELRLRLIRGIKMAMEDLWKAGCRILYINGSFVTSKEDPADFDACYENETVDIDYLRIHAPKLLNYYDLVLEAHFLMGNSFPRASAYTDYQGGIRLDWTSLQSDREVCLVCPFSPERAVYIYHQTSDDYAVENDISPSILVKWLEWFNGA